MVLRDLKRKAELARLTEIAEQFQYDDIDDMLEDMYVKKQMPIKAISYLFMVPQQHVRELMAQAGMKIRPRGGTRVVLLPPTATKSLVHEIERESIAVVADKMGVTVTTLRRWYKKAKQP